MTAEAAATQKSMRKATSVKRIMGRGPGLSKHLRHEPRRLGLTLEEGGWVTVEALLAGCSRAGMPLTRSELEEVVAQNDKRRFAFEDTGLKIRANQGHSVEVDLQLTPVVPPPDRRATLPLPQYDGGEPPRPPAEAPLCAS